MSNKHTQTEPELLINDAHGIYVMQSFCKAYLPYITNAQELKEDIDICIEGPDNEDYLDAWDNLLSNVKLTNDNGKNYTIGNLGESSDLWAIPENYEYPDEF
jgi:hypothetical protein